MSEHPEPVWWPVDYLTYSLVITHIRVIITTDYAALKNPDLIWIYEPTREPVCKSTYVNKLVFTSEPDTYLININIMPWADYLAKHGDKP